MFSSTLGPLPSHLTVYSPRASCLPLTVTGSLTWKEPLLAANTLVASSKASPSSKPLDSFDDFIRLLVLSRKPSGIGSGAAWDLPSRKNLRFVREGLQCCRGVKQRRLGRKTRSLCSGDCSHLGRQTESESSPLTPKTSLSKKNSIRSRKSSNTSRYVSSG